jgi:hypothetical protein
MSIYYLLYLLLLLCSGGLTVLALLPDFLRRRYSRLFIRYSLRPSVTLPILLVFLLLFAEGVYEVLCMLAFHEDYHVAEEEDLRRRLERGYYYAKRNLTIVVSFFVLLVVLHLYLSRLRKLALLEIDLRQRKKTS